MDAIVAEHKAVLERGRRCEADRDATFYDLLHQHRETEQALDAALARELRQSRRAAGFGAAAVMALAAGADASPTHARSSRTSASSRFAADIAVATDAEAPPLPLLGSPSPQASTTLFGHHLTASTSSTGCDDRCVRQRCLRGRNGGSASCSALGRVSPRAIERVGLHADVLPLPRPPRPLQSPSQQPSTMPPLQSQALSWPRQHAEHAVPSRGLGDTLGPRDDALTACGRSFPSSSLAHSQCLSEDDFLLSPTVQLQVIADDGDLTLFVHRVVLVQSPYFEARLIGSWATAHASEAVPSHVRGSRATTGCGEIASLPLRLPSGCPGRTMLLICRWLYNRYERRSKAAEVGIADASTAVAVANVVAMLLLDCLVPELVEIVGSLAVSPAEIDDLRRRCVPNPMPASCASVFRALEAASAAVAPPAPTLVAAPPSKPSPPLLAPAPSPLPPRLAAVAVAADADAGGGRGQQESDAQAVAATVTKTTDSVGSGGQRFNSDRGGVRVLIGPGNSALGCPCGVKADGLCGTAEIAASIAEQARSRLRNSLAPPRK
eukprot:TRINITY_DN44812_c0_g1_i1.p1 TRINITY_DN44812_c0_g1~~TRINITY_DN44812_c0_g1_i1.p1  ORF type:complete len:580 (-),score=90.77 TRINITY_DN44812_c0_g1_i1:5-1657(-)